MSAVIKYGLAQAGEAGLIAEMSRDLVESGLGWSWRPRRVRLMINHPEAIVLVARSGLELAGFAIMEFHDTHAHLNLLAVTEQRRRQGVAQDLVTWLHKSAGVAGIARIQLELREENTSAQRFYESMGYEQKGLVRGYYQGQESALKMTRQLIDPEIEAHRP